MTMPTPDAHMSRKKMTPKEKLDRLIDKAVIRGDGLCGALMDDFNIQRCPENYLKITGHIRRFKRAWSAAARKLGK